MKNFNWLIKQVFYKHTEKTARLTEDTPGIFYRVGFVDQQHANLCWSASESMMNHFSGRPFATMDKNPRGIMEGSDPNRRNFRVSMARPEEIRTLLENQGPFIMSLPLRCGIFHCVVVTGCTENQVIYNDPLTAGHKMISIEVLKNLCSENSSKVEVATERLVNKNNLINKLETTLPEPPPNIMPKNYQGFFSLDKMKNPCEAVLNFLRDYSKFSPWNLGHHYKKEVNDFIEKNKDKGLRDLLSDLAITFPKDSISLKDDLLKRVLTIEKMMNKDHELESDQHVIPLKAHPR